MEVQQVDENESFTNVMAQLDDNAQDEDDDLENDDINFNEDQECLFCCNNSLREKFEDQAFWIFVTRIFEKKHMAIKKIM